MTLQLRNISFAMTVRGWAGQLHSFFWKSRLDTVERMIEARTDSSEDALHKRTTIEEKNQRAYIKPEVEDAL